MLSVDSKYHPKIIGRKGAVISQIRKDYDVNVQFPDKGDEQQVGKQIAFERAFPHSLTQTGLKQLIAFIPIILLILFLVCLPVSLSSCDSVPLGCNRDLGL